MDEHLKNPQTHPLKHLRIQKLARLVKKWEKAGDKRYTGLVNDAQSGQRFLIAADIYTKFAILITAYKN